jgi:hypothetical protein
MDHVPATSPPAVLRETACYNQSELSLQLTWCLNIDLLYLDLLQVILLQEEKSKVTFEGLKSTGVKMLDFWHKNIFLWYFPRYTF